MAADEKIGLADPAGAKFATRSYSGPVEPYFDLSAEVIDIDVPYALAADIDLPAWTPVNYNRATGALVAASVSGGVGNATHMLAMPFKASSGATGMIGLKTSGHFNMDAINWPASFTTNTLKKFAFAAAGDNIRISKPRFSNDAIDIPN